MPASLEIRMALFGADGVEENKSDETNTTNTAGLNPLLILIPSRDNLRLPLLLIRTLGVAKVLVIPATS